MPGTRSGAIINPISRAVDMLSTAGRRITNPAAQGRFRRLNLDGGGVIHHQSPDEASGLVANDLAAVLLVGSGMYPGHGLGCHEVGAAQGISALQDAGCLDSHGGDVFHLLRRAP